jgi:hypothetical protein
MKKSFLIIIGVIIVIILIAIWVYLLFFGTPRTPDEIFANLGMSGGTDSAPVMDEEFLPPSDPVVQIAAPTSPLQQLTTRPIAGMMVQGTPDERIVWYMERGTGYIYQIDLLTRLETILSQVTIPQVTAATFSPSASSVLYTKSSPTIEHIVAVLATTSEQIFIADYISLPPMAENIVYETDTTLLYTISSNDSTTGYRYNLESEVREELFIIPFTQITVNWGNGQDSIVVYTKPDHRLPGYSYTVRNNQLNAYHQSGNGLVVVNTDTFSAHTVIPPRVPRPVTTLHTNTGDSSEIAQLIIPDKCAFHPQDIDTLWCASPSNALTPSFINDWYKGTVTSNDYLWQISVRGNSAKLLSAFENDTGRIIDAVDVLIAGDLSSILFRNRIDNTLWLYDLTF